MPFRDPNSSSHRRYMFYANLLFSVSAAHRGLMQYVNYTSHLPFSRHWPEIRRYLVLLYSFSLPMKNKYRFNKAINISVWRSEILQATIYVSYSATEYRGTVVFPCLTSQCSLDCLNLQQRQQSSIVHP